MTCLGPVTRGLSWALSTLDCAHRGDGTFFVSRNRREVLLLVLSQRGVGEGRLGYVPIKTRQVLMQPRLLEHLAVSRVDLVAHLAGVFEEQTFQQRTCDRLRAQLLVNAVFEPDDRLDVQLVGA